MSAVSKCPTCKAGMEKFWDYYETERTDWCPVCGTIVDPDENVRVPHLAKRYAIDYEDV